MMADKVTSADVARRAGVSRSAVSRVFTTGASASPATVEKVKQAAAELGYRPNTLARSLLTGRSRIIGVVVAYLDNQFYPQVLERLCHALDQRGYHVMVFMTSNTERDVAAVVEGILDHQVDGLVLASVSLTSDLAAQCQAGGVPVVLFNRRQADAGACAVVSDNHAGGRLAAQHLLDNGAQRVGYIAGWEGASTQREREAGFLEALRSAGKGLYAREVDDFNDPSARDAALAMFGRDDRPDAVFVANDHMAVTVMDVLRYELGLAVSDDVAVIGFDDVPAARWKAYDLTTVRQDTDAMVAATVDRLLTMVDGSDMRRTVEVPVALIRRSSA
ncbi:MAG: LacI family DNA-binding transcriptional regulator [Pseudomonadota bacterium]